MTRGNQRELARAKNMKKNSEKGKKKEDGLSATARKQRCRCHHRHLLWRLNLRTDRDAEIMQQKQQKAAGEPKESGGGGGAAGGKE